MNWSRGSLWRRKDDLEKAIADYTEAIRLDPQCAPVYCSRGFAYEKKGTLTNPSPTLPRPSG